MGTPDVCSFEFHDGRKVGRRANLCVGSPAGCGALGFSLPVEDGMNDTDVLPRVLL